MVTGEGQSLFRGGAPEETSCRRYAFPLETPDASGPDGRSAQGTLYFALSTADIEQSLAEVHGVLAVTIVAGTALALVAATLLVKYTVGRTLRRLLRNVRMAMARSRGDLTTSPSRDHVEQLTQMLDALTQELQGIVEDEKRLTARTLSEQVEQGQLWERSRKE